jgi:hypothetical protein
MVVKVENEVLDGIRQTGGVSFSPLGGEFELFLPPRGSHRFQLLSFEAGLLVDSADLR